MMKLLTKQFQFDKYQSRTSLFLIDCGITAVDKLIYRNDAYFY